MKREKCLALLRRFDELLAAVEAENADVPPEKQLSPAGCEIKALVVLLLELRRRDVVAALDFLGHVRRCDRELHGTLLGLLRLVAEDQ